MDRARVTQQSTSSTISLRSEIVHDAPSPRALRRGTFHGPLQWALEGAGWGVVRPVSDFVMVCIAVLIALGGFGTVFNVDELRAPLLTLPFVVVALFYLRGLYRTKMRTQVLDGIVPVISGVSVAAMAVAVLGMLLHHEVPEQGEWIRAWFYRARGRRLRTHRARARPAPRSRAAPDRQARADHGRRRRGRAGGPASGEPPRVRPRSRRLPR